jgi:transposase
MEDALCPAALPDDPASLKSIIAMIAQQRDQATQQLSQRIAELEDEKQRLQQQWEMEKLRLQHQLEQLRKRYYGPRADTLDVGQLLLEFALALEKRPVNPQDLGQEVLGEAAQDAARAARRVKRGRRNIAAFERLPVMQKVHDLPQDQKPCPCCNQMRQKIGEQRTWQIEYLPGQFQRIEHVQYKYACKHCEQEAQNPNITLAQKPLQPIDKGMAGPGLLAYVITSKFADHLPLYRLESIFSRNGFEIDRSTMSLWAGDVADLVKPLHQLMIERVLGSHVIATDDTVLPMLAPQKAKQARLWVYLGDEDHPYNVFDFTLSRSRDGPSTFLKDYGFDKLTPGNQVLLADAYGGYEGICIEKQIVQAGCWSHARRKFVDAQSLAPAIAIEALGLIGKLFAVEQEAKDLDPVQRLTLRQEQGLPVIGQLHQKLLAWKQQLLPRHPMAEAIGYVLNQWKPLTAFLADGAIPIHNNLAEQQMKRIALGRKNYLFVGNPRGGRTAAILSSITSTCRRHGIDPQRYLTQLLSNLPTTPLSQVADWLPDAWKRRQDADAVPDAHATR